MRKERQGVFMKIETKDHQGGERRNGAKLRLSLRDYITVGTIVVGLIVAGVTLNLTVAAQGEDSKKQSKEINTLGEENDEQDKIIITIQADVKHIKEKVDKFEEVQMQQMKLLYQIKGALDDR